MKRCPWVDTFPGAITVCDGAGTILEMNSKAVATHEKDGGAALIGRNLYDCHPEAASAKLAEVIASQRVNAYTIEKSGIKKLIYQAPWYTDSHEFGGVVELSLEIPFETPHFVRKG